MTNTELKHTPGPLRISDTTPSLIKGTHHGKDNVLLAQALEPQDVASIDEMWANARLLAASYNAFDSAATRLNLNAVELAERMQDGGSRIPSFSGHPFCERV